MEEDLFRAIDEGKTVAFADAAVGTTSADVPMTEVGNISYAGCSPKYLDGIITGLLINGQESANGAIVEAGENEEITLQIGLQNTAYSRWLCEGVGAVSLISTEDSDTAFRLDIPREMAKRDRVPLTVTLGKDCKHIAANLVAADRGIFGDRLKLTVNRG